MKLTKPVQLRIPGALILSAMLLGTSLAAQAVPQTAPAPDRNIAPPGAQRQVPPQQPQKQLPGTRAPQPISPKLSDGVIEGFVYWDTSLIPHKPAGSCNGLAVTVNVDNGLSGPFKGFKPLATLTNNFKYVGQVKSFLAGGKVVTYDVCTYGYDQVPVGPELQVQLTVTQAFARNAVPQPSVAGPITIINGQCNMLPSLNPTTLADLTAHWGSCQKMAYGVSFSLQQLLQTQSAGGSPSKSGSNSKALPVTLSAPKQGRKITNPKGDPQDAAIIAVLQKQRSAADAEAAAMKLGLRPAGVQVSPGPSQPMAATGAGRSANAHAPTPGAISGNTASPPHPDHGVSATLPPQFSSLAATCSHDPSMRALTVSGGPTPAIFTPDPKYNFYTITGCSFGKPGTNSKVYIYFQGTFRKDFQIQEWTDNWIKLSLDQNISGVDDQKDVTLVIQSDDGKQWTRNGYRFYAARQTVLLTRIPQSDFSLNHFRPDNSGTQSWKATYTSGSSPSVIPNFSGLSAEVHWDLTSDPDGTPMGGSDIYDLSHLHPTFALDSAWMEWKDVSCSDPNYNQFAASKTNWSIDWYGASGVQVIWQGQVCKNTPGSCGGAFQGDCFAYMPESNYGINVWVTGPRGLDPWTGKPIS
jgi:hypothetical protein